MTFVFKLALSVVASIGLAASAAAQELPEDIATPYVAYTQAMEANDLATARVFALQAWEAGERLAFDPATLAILADNYAQLANAAGDHEAAAEAFVRVAEIQQDAGDPAHVIAETWIFAASTALTGGQTGDAVRYADRAGDLSERVEGPAAAQRPQLSFLSRAIHAQALWMEGRVSAAALRSQEALRIAETETVSGEAYLGLMAFIQGAHHAIRNENADAAYRLSQAYAYLPDQRLALGSWVQYVRDELSTEERAALLDRIAEADWPDYSEADLEPDNDNPYSDLEGWVDTEPETRTFPEYPRDAAMAGVEGVVLIEFTVDEDGRVTDPEVLFSIPAREFGQAGLAALEGWRYTPATLNGEPVRREGVAIEFNFVLEDD